MHGCPFHQNSVNEVDCTCPNPDIPTGIDNAGRFGYSCRQCQYKPVFQTYHSSLATLTKQQEDIRIQRQALLAQRVALAGQPFTTSLKLQKEHLSRRNSILCKMSQDLALVGQQLKAQLRKQIADIDAATPDNVFCVNSLSTVSVINGRIAAMRRQSFGDWPLLTDPTVARRGSL